MTLRLTDLPAVPPSGKWWVGIHLGDRDAIVDSIDPIVPTWRRLQGAMLDPKKGPRPADVRTVATWLEDHPECWSD